MSDLRGISQEQDQGYNQRSIRHFHPWRVMLILSFFGIGLLFAGLLFGFWMTADSTWRSIAPPKAFIVSSVVIFMSSVSIRLAQKAFAKEQRMWFRTMLVTTGLLGLTFLVSQLIGWVELEQAGFGLATNNGSAYIYLISALHGLHLMAGLLVLGFFIYRALKMTGHPGTAIFYFTDPVKQLNLKLIATYWHFVDGVWLFLMAVFLWQFL